VSQTSLGGLKFYKSKQWTLWSIRSRFVDGTLSVECGKQCTLTRQLINRDCRPS